MKKCTKCDLSYEDDKKFCRKCGCQLETSSSNSPKELVKKEVYQNRLKTDPLNIELLHEYTQFLFDNSFFEEATIHSLKILEIKKSDTFAKELLFKSYLKLKSFKEASEILEQLLAEKPNDIKYLEYQATILTELKNFDKAIECYDKIIKLQPNNISTLNAKALTLLENNNIEEASAVFYKIFLENQDDKLTTVYVGIYYTLKGDYETARNILTPILSEKDTPIPKIHKSRGILYLTFSLCNLNAEMSEIKKWFNIINFKILSTYYPNNDEKTLVQTFSSITNNALNTLKTANIKINLLNFNTDSSKFCFTENSNSVLAELNYNLGIKQNEFKLYTAALNSFKQAVELSLNENKYKEKYDEIKKIIEIESLQKGKRKRKIIVITMLTIIIVIISIIIYHNLINLKDNRAWEQADNANTIQAYQKYINENPIGNHLEEAIKLKEDLAWKHAKGVNTISAYQCYIDSYPKGTYIQEANNTKYNIDFQSRSGTFTDKRDGKVYKTIKIGDQTWMAENLAYKIDNNGCFAYDNNENNVATYGFLYNFKTAKKVCPIGWHLPSNVEWTKLIDYLGGVELAGGKLKSFTGWNNPNTGANNESGFNAIPSGKCNTFVRVDEDNHKFYYEYSFYEISNHGYWWSSIVNSTNSVWVWSLFYNTSIVYKECYEEDNGFSVRCVRD